MLGKYNRRTVSQTTGKVVGNATVEFFWQASGLPMTVYSDADGNNALGSSVQSDADGRIAVFLPPGRYRIVVTFGGDLVEEITYEPIVNDLATSVVDDFALRLIEMQDPAQTSYIRTLTSGFSEFRSISQVRTDLSINNVNNTSDANKPVSTATQTALNGKQDNITGAASTIASANLTADRAMISDGSGKAAISAVTATELGYLSGTTSSVQTQINAKANTADLGTAASADVTTSSTDTTSGRLMQVGDGGLLSNNSVVNVPGGNLDALRVTGMWRTANTTTGTPLSDIGQVLHMGQSSNYAVQLILPCFGNATAYIRNIQNGTPGTWRELYHTGNLTGAVSTIATSNLTASRALTSDGSGKVSASAVTATELGHLSGASGNIQQQLNAIAGGGTLVSWGGITGTLANQTDLQNALNGKAASVHTHTKADVGLANVDNTSDANKPISTATQTALDAKAPASLGFRTSNASTTLALADNNGVIFKTGTSSYTYTVPANSSVSLPVGYTVTLINDATSGNITASQGSGVAIMLAGPRTAGNKTIAPGGMATLVKVGTDRWYINGAGIS